MLPGSQYLIFVYFMRYFTGFTISHMRYYQDHNISYLHISWDMSPFSKYLIVKDFWDTNRITISHICIFHEIFHRFYNILKLKILWDVTRITISHICIFYEIFYWVHNISYEILPGSQYLIFAYFMRYFTIFKISHNLRFLRYYQDHNISYLYISWDISPVSQYLMVEDFIS